MSKLVPSTVRHVGFLLATTPDDWDNYIQWFEAALKKDIKVTYLPPKGAFGDPNAIADAAKDLVKYCDVIVTASTAAALALKTATQGTNAQFVYASVGDPETSGLKPQSGGNFTGGSNNQVAAVTRRVDYMLSKPKDFEEKFAVVGDYTDPAHQKTMDDVFSRLTTLKKQVVPLADSTFTPGTTDIDTFITKLGKLGVKSLYVCSDLWITVKSNDLNKKAHDAKMKTMFEFEEHKAKHGGDDYDGDSWKPLFEKAADYVDKILSGTKAGDLPMYKL